MKMRLNAIHMKRYPRYYILIDYNQDNGMDYLVLDGDRQLQMISYHTKLNTAIKAIKKYSRANARMQKRG